MLRGFTMAVVGVAALLLGGGALAESGLVITDLAVPRGLSLAGSDLLVADQGNGRILRVTPQGSISVIADGIPSAVLAEADGDVVVGVTTAIEFGGTYFFTVGGQGEPGLGSVYSVLPGQKPVLLADLAAYEAANNTDGDVDLSGAPELLTNPYDLVADGAGGLYVSDAAANAVLHISAGGEISPYAIFPNRPNPLFPALGGPTVDQVPTGLERGPDGALYVSTLTGFPFPPGAAQVYRLEDRDGDGNALDEGEATVYAAGLTGATNLVFDRDGSLLVTEFSLDFLNQAPGRLVRVVNGAITEVVAEPLISPTGVTVMLDGKIVVTQEFLGIVAGVDAASGPAPGGSGGGITPPNTGDGGLAR